MLEFAIPSKGRLQTDSVAFLNAIGAKVRGQHARSYRPEVEGLDGVSLWLLSSDEIARRLTTGALHAGLIGEDLLREYADVDLDVSLLRPLGFGYADLVVATPACWIDCQTADDLKEVFAAIRMRHHRPGLVATKYTRQTLAWFRAAGIEDFRIVRSAGATEAAPSSGAADVIVDITTTGETLRANHLRPLSTAPIVRSQVNIAASLRAPWSAAALGALETVLSRHAAVTDTRRLLQFAAGSAGKRIESHLVNSYKAEVVSGGAYVVERHALDAAADVRALLDTPVAVIRPQAVFAEVSADMAAFRARISASQ